MRKGRLQEIIMEETQNHNLPENVMICKLQPSEVQFNYKSPPAAIFLANLVRESDLTAARARVQQNKEQGTTVQERLLAMKGKISAAKLTKCGTHTLGIDLLELVRLVNMGKRKKKKIKRKQLY